MGLTWQQGKPYFYEMSRVAGRAVCRYLAAVVRRAAQGDHSALPRLWELFARDPAGLPRQHGGGKISAPQAKRGRTAPIASPRRGE